MCCSEIFNCLIALYVLTSKSKVLLNSPRSKENVRKIG